MSRKVFISAGPCPRTSSTWPRWRKDMAAPRRRRALPLLSKGSSDLLPLSPSPFRREMLVSKSISCETAIAHAAHGDDVASGRSELAPQAADVYIHGARIEAVPEFMFPHRFAQQPARQ